MLSRNQLQLIRWISAVLCAAMLVSSWFWQIRGGWAVLWFFGFALVSAPAALITLRIYGERWSKGERR